MGACYDNVGDLRIVCSVAQITLWFHAAGMSGTFLWVLFGKMIYHGFITPNSNEEFYISGVGYAVLFFTVCTIFLFGIAIPSIHTQGWSLFFYHTQAIFKWLSPCFYWGYDVKSKAALAGKLYRKRIKARCADIHEVMLKYSQFPELYS